MLFSQLYSVSKASVLFWQQPGDSLKPCQPLHGSHVSHWPDYFTGANMIYLIYFSEIRWNMRSFVYVLRGNIVPPTTNLLNVHIFADLSSPLFLLPNKSMSSHDISTPHVVHSDFGVSVFHKDCQVFSWALRYDRFHHFCKNDLDRLYCCHWKAHNIG